MKRMSLFVYLMLGAVIVSGCNRAEFKPISRDQFKQLLADNGLKVCAETLVDLKTSGVVDAKSYTLSTNCEKIPNALRTTVIQFSSPEARDSAIRTAYSTHRDGAGLGWALTYGPYVIVVQGDRETAEAALFARVLKDAGAGT